MTSHAPLEQNCERLLDIYTNCFMRRVFGLRLLRRSCQVPWKDVCSLLLRHMYVRVINPPDLCCLMALRSVKLCHSSGFKHPGRPVLVLVPAPSQKLHTYNTAALFQSGAASLISCGCRGLIDSNATRGFKSGGWEKQGNLLMPWSESQGFISMATT